MTVSGALARPMLAGIFIYGGVDALRDPESKVKAADDVAPMIAEALRLPTTDTVALVRINGGVQVLAGTMLGLGKARRLSALVLAASLVPTTYAGHRFWEEVDEDRRAQQRVQFLKNVAMLGGLVLAAGDTGGRPSVPWQARRATKQAIEATVAAGVATEEAAKQVLGATKSATKSAKKSASKAAKGAQGGAMGAKAAASAVLATAASHGSDVTERASQAAHSAVTSDLGADLTKRARQAAANARNADFAEEARRLAQAAQKAYNGELTGRALKATQKAARKAAKKAAAERADLAKRATRASKRARKRIRKAPLVVQVAATAGKVQQTASEALGRVQAVAGDAASNGAVERVRETAGALIERTRDALPVG